MKEKEITIGDFVSVLGDRGRIVQVGEEYCLVHLRGIVEKVPKKSIRVLPSRKEILKGALKRGKSCERDKTETK